MNSKNPEISIIIATFNSARTLKKCLESVKRQTLAKNKIEVLIVDGGSTDDTLKIAKEYKCRILHNEMVDPLNAKHLGLHSANGHYLMGLDSDEVLKNRNSLRKRLEVFKKDKRVNAVHSSGYITPRNSPFVNYYLNEFGEPFTFFIYKLTKDYLYFLRTMRERYKVAHEDRNYILFDVSKTKERLPLMEVLVAGGITDLDYLKRTFPKLIHKKKLFLPNLHLHLLSKSPYIAVSKNDPLYHYSAEELSRYIKKIRWRVKNNIFFGDTLGSAGFLKREKFENKLNDLKKYLFIPYAFSVVLPLVDALWLIATRKNFTYIIHLPLTVLTASLIVYYFLLKKLGYNPELTGYGDSKKIVKKWQ